MKKTFFKLSEEKRSRVLDACITEFGRHGFEKGSTDRIIKKAGISKGGLYEYISNKHDLYLYVVEYTYSSLYSYILKVINERNIIMPDDVLERFRLVSSIAFDFYIDHPEMISFIEKSDRMTDEKFLKKIDRIFLKSFNRVFGNIKSSDMKYDIDRVMSLLRWLLMRTRKEFLQETASGKGQSSMRKKYISNWDFYLSILKDGIYKLKNQEKQDAGI